MMLVLLLLALAADPPTAGQPPTAQSVTSPPAAASTTDGSSDDTASNLAELQQMYDQSCAAREYGAYDDLCDQLRQQMKGARVEADREARRQAAAARRHPRPPSTQPPIATPPAKTAPAASQS